MAEQGSAGTATKAPRLLVLGANGRIGQQVVAEALARGAAVTAFVRNPAGPPAHPQLTIAEGRVAEDRAELAKAMRGQDAVISALGNPLWLKGLKGPAIVEASFRNAIAAMQEAGVRRFLAPLAWGTGASAKPAGALVRLIAATLIRRDYRDFTAAEQALTSSGLEWTIAYFGSLTDAPASTGWLASTAMKKPGQLAIARADVAQFLVSAALERKFVRQRVVLSGAKAP